MVKLTLEDAQKLKEALYTIVDYLTDNSCGDPDCCSGPYYTFDDFENSNKVLNLYGLEVEGR